MHPALTLEIDHVKRLRELGVRDFLTVRKVLDEAYALSRKKVMHKHPELFEKAGLCQRVLVNQDAYNVMKRIITNQERKLAENGRLPASCAEAQVGVPFVPKD